LLIAFQVGLWMAGNKVLIHRAREDRGRQNIAKRKGRTLLEPKLLVTRGRSAIGGIDKGIRIWPKRKRTGIDHLKKMREMGRFTDTKAPEQTRAKKKGRGKKTARQSSSTPGIIGRSHRTKKKDYRKMHRKENRGC